MVLNIISSSNAPSWLHDNVLYLTMMGSVAYGVSNDNSDIDIYGFCMPPKSILFPHTAGEIPGFATQTPTFGQWQQHHIKDPNGKNKTYDFSVYSIVRYFQLCMDNNPNMIDSLFTPRRAVLHSTAISERLRENRKMFLHKGAFHKFSGYAYSQMSKIENKTNSSNPKRAESIEKYGYDVKFAYHVVRLAQECEQILETHDLDIEKGREILKSIRRGEWELARLKDWFTEKEKHLARLYETSTLQHRPNEANIKALLLECIESHYGTISQAVAKNVDVDDMITELQGIIAKYKK